MPAVSQAQFGWMGARCAEGKSWACEYIRGQRKKGLPKHKKNSLQSRPRHKKDALKLMP